MQEAKYYSRQEAANDGETKIQCELCPKMCIISEDKIGFCRVRRVKAGKLYTENYAAVTGIALDPIEKKPLLHFFPGASILSVGSWGCNFTCQFCQNWHIAQVRPDFRNIMPGELAELTAKQTQSCIGTAYTYSEPTVWYEYILAAAEEVKTRNLHNVLVTNGFINREPLQALLPVIDAMNIDVKAYNEEFYRNVCAGSLKQVKNTVEIAVQSCHVEITTLIIPGLNDSDDEIGELAKWLAGLNPDIPLHLTRYFPQYKMQIQPTSIERLLHLQTAAQEFLNYVYIGNVAHSDQTHCPNCKQVVLDRSARRSFLSKDKTCSYCGQSIKVVGEVLY